MLLKQTKIVATVSDKRCEVEFIKQLFDAGMNVVRMNTAHLDYDGQKKIIDNVRAVSNRIGILMDTKGPEVRTTTLAEAVSFQAGDRVKVVGDPGRETTRECIAVSYPHFVHDLNLGDRVLIDDGLIELTVDDIKGQDIRCTVRSGGALRQQLLNIGGFALLVEFSLVHGLPPYSAGLTSQ